MHDNISFRHSGKIRAGLALALGIMDASGWFGQDADNNRIYVGGDSDSCVCAVVAIEQAADVLTIPRSVLRFAFIENAGLVAKGAQASHDGWATIVNWNDVPNRHPVTVRRAFQRAIKKAA